MVQWKQFPLLHILACLTFLLTGLTVNILQLTLRLTLHPWPILYSRLNYYLVYTLYGQLLFLVDWWSGSPVTVWCEPAVRAVLQRHRPAESALIIINHHYELDWLYGWAVADRAGLLGHCRAFAKASLRWVPVLGWSSVLSDVIFLQRNFAADQAGMQTGLRKLAAFPSPVWLFLLPEGTRKTEAKLRASQEWAAGRGLPALQHHLTPRTRGFSHTVTSLDPAVFRAVYVLTLAAVPAENATLTSILAGRPAPATVVLRRYEVSSLPADKDSWLHNIFAEKDRIKAALLEGTWPQLNESHAVFPSTLERLTLPARCYTLVITGFCTTVTGAGLCWLAWAGGPLTWLLLAATLLLTWAALAQLVSVSKIQKQSSPKPQPELTRSKKKE